MPGVCTPVCVSDHHIEGSSSERDCQVAETIGPLTVLPDEETDISLYGGIDLHANNRVVVGLNDRSM
jgi:hypothetical protein